MLEELAVAGNLSHYNIVQSLDGLY